MPEADVAIVAGDIKAPVRASQEWLYRNIVARGMPVVFVAGNHESYGFAIDETIVDGQRDRARYPGVHFLENEEVILDGVRFLGATLWTDFNLYGDPAQAMHTSQLMMNDFKLIYTLSEERNGGFLVPEDTLEFHLTSRAWLEAELSKTFDGKSVVVTHHAPHPFSVHPRFKAQMLSASFVSDLSDLIERYQPSLWVHGHVHDSFDYHVGKTRIVCNPRGYVRRSFSKGKEIENPFFDPFKIVEI
jgi:hypothetical protein